MKRLACAALALVMAAPLAAQSPEIVVQGTNLKMGYAQATGTVGFGDLNLKTADGVNTLNARVKAEAERLCNPSAGSAPVRQDQATCVNSMIAAAKPQVDQVVARARM